MDEIIEELERKKEEEVQDSDYSPPMDPNKRPSFLVPVDKIPVGKFDQRVCMNLEPKFLAEESIRDETETIKSYLRIRPYTLKEGETDVFQIIDAKTVIANSLAAGNRGARLGKKTQYNFNKVLDPSCSQQGVFDQAIVPLMEHFEKGENCLVFSYGATNSGKTFTMQGRRAQYGVIPRTLDFIFTRYEDRLYKKGDIQPFMYEGTRCLSEDEQRSASTKKKILLDIANKSKAMDKRRSFLSRGETGVSSQIESFKYVQGRPLNGADECPSYDGSTANMVCMWASFVEVYNEKCYDLLDIEDIGKEKWKPRKDLKVVCDKGGYAYIRDVTEIPVLNVEEAYGIYVAGYQKLQVGSTKINKRSSRSHSFFTIRVVEVAWTRNVAFPMQTYRMTFCDLAGVERLSQTGNTGGLLQESSSINKSLLSLLKVIRLIREKQITGVSSSSYLETIPFRESKLTRIFQGYFKSSTHIAMIVNVNPNPVMLESTIQTLQNSAIASSIISYRPPKVPKIKAPICLNSSARNLEDLIEESEGDCAPEIPSHPLPVPSLQENKRKKRSKPKMFVQPAKTDDTDDSDKENENECPSSVIPRRTYATIVASLQEQLRNTEAQLSEAEEENRKLRLEVRFIESETREKMLQLWHSQLRNNDNSPQHQVQGPSCPPKASKVSPLFPTYVSAATQTDDAEFAQMNSTGNVSS